MSEWLRVKCDTATCVEVKTPGPEIVLLRTSDTPHRDVAMTRDEWSAFIKAIKAGEFDAV